MKLKIKCHDMHGNYIGTVSGEALPLHVVIPAPADCKVLLSQNDVERLQRAFLRFDRAMRARQALGNISLTFTSAGFQAASQPEPATVKLLALEMRPFFLEKDPLFFEKLISLKSLGAAECIRPCLKSHRRRWKDSAFGGRMMISVGGQPLDTLNVVKAWFNHDFFHTESQNPDELSLEGLIGYLGGEEQAITLLAHHLVESLRVIAEFFNNVYATSELFGEWAASVPGWIKPQEPGSEVP